MSLKFSEQAVWFAYEVPHFHYLLMSTVMKETKAIPTMGVSVDGVNMNFFYNPDFTDPLSTNVRGGELFFCIGHELFHILLHHCTKRRSTDPAKQELDNRAMDLAINSMLAKQAKMVVPCYQDDIKIKKNGKEVFTQKAGDPFVLMPATYGFSEGLTYEQYKDLLIKRDDEEKEKKKKGVGGGGGGQGQGQGQGEGSDDEYTAEINGQEVPVKVVGDKAFISGDHSEFEENPGAQEAIKGFVQNFQKTKHWGDMPGDLQDMIIAAQSTQVNWERKFNHRMGRFYHPRKKASFRRPHRLLGYPFPGKTSATTDSVYMFPDTSASVNDEELAAFLGEGVHLSRKMPVLMAPFDTKVQMKPTKIRKGMKGFTIKGRGGTDFQCVMDAVDEYSIKNLVILTDGYAPEPNYPKLPVKIIWVISPGGNSDVASWRGEAIFMK